MNCVIARFTVLAFLLAVNPQLRADDWPTHLRDNQRSGHSSENLQLPLRQSWSFELPTPTPAWPLPAKQDYWNRKTNLRPRIVFDRANGMVASKGRLIVGSSADDQVRAFDQKSGELLWRHFTEGPVRLAPTIWKDRVLFAADDGYSYCCNLASGTLLWKTRPNEIGERRIPGNGRLISQRPIRSGILVDEKGTAYFAAGIFPQHGVYYFSLNPLTGKIIDRTPIGKSIQGYLQQRNGRIFAATGRDPHGADLSSQQDASELRRPSVLDEGVFCTISCENLRFIGSENRVTALQEDQEVWSSPVEGRVYAMAISDGQLFASTDRGKLYAFASQPVGESPNRPVEAGLGTPPPRSGYQLLIEPSDELVLDTARSSTHRIVVSVQQQARATNLNLLLERHHLRTVASVHVNADGKLPYANHIFQRIQGGTLDSVSHLLRPETGVATAQDGELRGSPAHNARGQWTHTYGDSGNSASSQTQLAEKLQLQWFGGPGPRHMVDRHMRTMPPLANQGILYIPGLNQITAIDAYSGSFLWRREIPNSTRIGILKDCGWIVSRGSDLLVAVKDACHKFTTAPFSTPPINTTDPLHVPFPDRSWGYLAAADDILVGSSTQPNSHRQTLHRAAILEGAYSDDRPVVCSDGLFAFDLAVTEQTWANLKWKYTSKGSVLNPSIATTAESVVFLESEARSDTGRVLVAEFLDRSAHLVALNLKTGQTRWRTRVSLKPGVQSAFVIANAKLAFLVNSRNDETVNYDVSTFDIKTGTLAWTATQDNQLKPGGVHGEQDKHPVLVGSRLIVEPFAYDMDTGHRITEVNLSKRGYGCGTISAAADALFFRSGTLARYSLHTNQIDLVTSVSRPGCWINMIPASGMLLIPEGSSGCTCNYPVQTSMALSPVQ